MFIRQSCKTWATLKFVQALLKPKASNHIVRVWLGYRITSQKNWDPTRWAPTIYKWNYKPYQWPDKWVARLFNPTQRVTPPPMIHLQAFYMGITSVLCTFFLPEKWHSHVSISFTYGNFAKHGRHAELEGRRGERKIMGNSGIRAFAGPRARTR